MKAEIWKQFRDMVNEKLQELGESENILLGDIILIEKMAVKEIVEKYLRDNKFDGLFTDGCGCVVDDLAPCGNIHEKCEAGYKGLCTCGDWFISGSGEGKCPSCRE